MLKSGLVAIDRRFEIGAYSFSVKTSVGGVLPVVDGKCSTPVPKYFCLYCCIQFDSEDSVRTLDGITDTRL